MDTRTDYMRWSEMMDGHMPRWWIEHATQRDLQDTTNAMLLGFRDAGDTEAKLREIVGRRLFDVVRAWVALPECAICGKEVTLGMIEEGKKRAAARGAGGPQPKGPQSSGLGFPKERDA